MTSSGQANVRYILFLASILVITLVMGGLLSKAPQGLVLAGVVGISLFILCFFSVKYALYTLILSMLLSPEFGSRTTEGGGITVRLEDFLLPLIGFSWFARTAIYKNLGLLKKTPLNRPVFYYILACVVSTALGMMFGEVQIVKGFFFVLKYVEYFIVYFMTVNYVSDRKQLRNLVIAIITVFVIVCLASIAQIPQGERITAPFEGKGGEPNTLGGYLLLVLSIVVGIVLNTDKKDSLKYKMLFVGMSVLSLIPILFCQSRGTWLAIVPWYLTVWVISKRKALLGVVLALMVAISPVVMPKSVKDRFLYTFEKQEGWAADYQEQVGGVTLDTSTSERVSSMKKAWEAYMEHPVFGYGITGWRFLDAQYLKTLVETGLLGFAAFGFLIYTILKVTWNGYRRTNDKFYKGISMGFFAGAIAMLTHGLSTNTFIIVRIMEPFWFLMAIVVVIPSIEEAEALQKKDGESSPVPTK